MGILRFKIASLLLRQSFLPRERAWCCVFVSRKDKGYELDFVRKTQLNFFLDFFRSFNRFQSISKWQAIHPKPTLLHNITFYNFINKCLISVMILGGCGGVRWRCRITGNNTNRHFSLQYIIIQDRRLLNAEVFYQCSYYYALTFVEFHSLGKTFVGQNQNRKKNTKKNHWTHKVNGLHSIETVHQNTFLHDSYRRSLHTLKHMLIIIIKPKRRFIT